MWCLILLLVDLCLANNFNQSGRSYYFKMNKNSNELKIYNRIQYINHNISDYNYNYNNYEGGNGKAQSVKPQRKEIQAPLTTKRLFLDEEWNFNHTKLNKTKLPLFLNDFYESKCKEKNNSNTLRILFNTNANLSSNIIYFNLNSIKPNEKVLDAKMFIYINIENDSAIYEKSIVLRIYQFEKETGKEVSEAVLSDNPDIHKLFNVIYMSKARKGWQSFVVKKPLDNWIMNNEANLGLLVTISSFEDNKIISILNDTNTGTFRTFTVVTVTTNGDKENISNTNLKKTKEGNCKRNEIYVDFKKMHWDDFIISPEGFSTFDCVGNCKQLDNSTINHVRLLSAIIPQRNTCCVPVDYSVLPIMFYDKFNNIAIKSYDKMIPEKCGCR